ncbi:Dolichyl-phosphate-mannose-protein mannosyltransferase [Phycisphaerae bacterium RAS2]|nr:Dolichyl-phosphate-mannose-protein mannosyltransferase [Phycisphaerae bacterium RAS2]
MLISAILCQIGVIAWAEWQPKRFDYPDSHRYLRVARNIAAGNGPIESASIRAGTDPLYPYLLSIPIRLGFMEDIQIYRFARGMQAVLGVLIVALTAAVARRWVSDRAALGAAALLATHPILLFFHGLVLTEIMYIAFLMAAWFFLARLREQDGLPDAFACAGAIGILLGLATLTRSTSLFLPILVLPLIWHHTNGPVHNKARIALAAALVYGAVLAPNILRNDRLFGRFIPTRVGGGASLLEALGPWADGGPGMDRIVYPPAEELADEAERDAVYRRAALDWARSHPRETLSLAWTKLRRTWSITLNAPGYESALFTAVGWLTVAPIFVLAAVGVWRLRRQGWTLLFLLSPAIYFSAIHMVFVGSVRYRLPAMPLLMILVVIGAGARLRLDRPRGNA